MRDEIKKGKMRPWEIDLEKLFSVCIDVDNIICMIEQYSATISYSFAEIKAVPAVCKFYWLLKFLLYL